MYIERRRRVFYLVHDIPADVQGELGRKRFVASLKTRDMAQAKVRAAALEMQWRLQIENARKGPTGQYIQKAGEFWQGLLDKAGSDEERKVHEQALQAEAQNLAFDIGGNFTLKAGSGDSLFAGASTAEKELPGHQAAARLVGIATGRQSEFTAAMEDFLKLARGTKKSLTIRRSTLTKFGAEFPYMADVVRPKVQEWINRQAAAGKQTPTLQRMLAELRGYWTYLWSIQAAPDGESPFTKLVLPQQVKNGRGDKHRPFAPADVVKLWREASRRHDSDLADLIELGMYTGARIEELCSLPVANVNIQEGWFKIEDAKSPAGNRQVPIHSKMHPLLKWLIGKRTSGFVFAGLGSNKYGDRSATIGKRFGRLKNDLGFGPDQVFHSIRKTVATMLKDAGVSESLCADILGHEKPPATYALYSGGSSLGTKKAAIEKIAYLA